MTSLRAFAAAALVALAACSGPLVGGTVDENRLCLLMKSQTVPGAPPAVSAVLGAQEVTLEATLDLGSKIPGLDRPDAVTGEIRLLSLTALADPPSTDLGGVDTAEVSIVDAAGAATQVMHYARPAGTTTTSSLAMTQDANPNLLPELQGGALRYRITFKGVPPPTAWTADVETCFSAHLTLDALKLMK